MKKFLQSLFAYSYPVLVGSFKTYWTETAEMVDSAMPGKPGPVTLRGRSDTVNSWLLYLFGRFMDASASTRYSTMDAQIRRAGLLMDPTGRPEFKALFNHKNREPIYGCWEGRIIYTSRFATAEARVAIDHQRYVKTDTLNDTSWRTQAFKKALGSGKSEDELSQIVEEHAQEYGEVVSREDLDESIRFYTELAEHARYSPSLLMQQLSQPSNWSTFKRDVKESDARKLSGPALEEMAAYEKLTRRACKFGIFYALNHGRNVHFILDGLLEDISSFSNKVSNPDVRPPITVSELLYVYRYRKELGKFRDDSGAEVIFYLGGRRVEAPWKKDANKDVPGELKKHLDALKGFLDVEYKTYRSMKQQKALSSMVL